ncbi:hypothetical protein ACFPVT_04310 [Corynebacterium choanae]
MRPGVALYGLSGGCTAGIFTYLKDDPQREFVVIPELCGKIGDELSIQLYDGTFVPVGRVVDGFGESYHRLNLLEISNTRVQISSDLGIEPEVKRSISIRSVYQGGLYTCYFGAEALSCGIPNWADLDTEYFEFAAARAKENYGAPVISLHSDGTWRSVGVVTYWNVEKQIAGVQSIEPLLNHFGLDWYAM